MVSRSTDFAGYSKIKDPVILTIIHQEDVQVAERMQSLFQKGINPAGASTIE